MEPVLAHDADANGQTYRMLRGPRWTPVSHGLYAPADGPADLVGRCGAMRLVLPRDAAFSHYTAGRLLRLWLPVLPSSLPIFATAPGCGTHIARSGFYVTRSDGACAGVGTRWGFHLSHPTTVLGQLAEDLACLDLVIAIDSALHSGLCTREELEKSIRPRQRGAPMLRRAIRYVDARSESAWETVLRLLHVWAGFDVVPQYVVRDEWGHFIARGDLRLAGLRRLHEYDGADHRTLAQHQQDLGREKALSRIRWERYGYTASELARSPVSIIRDAEAAYGLAHRASRLTNWHREWERSAFSLAGARRLRERLARFEHRPRLV